MEKNELKVLKKRGKKPLPESEKKITTFFMIAPELLDKLDTIAKQRMVSRSRVIEQCLINKTTLDELIQIPF